MVRKRGVKTIEPNPPIKEKIRETPVRSIKLREIFQSCQTGAGGVSQWVKKLRALHLEKEENEDEFFQDFVFYLRLPIACEDRSKYVNRVLEVVSQFASSFLEKEEENNRVKDQDKDEEEEEGEELELPSFLSKLFHWLLDHHNVEGVMARLRICLMLNRLLKLMGENASIDDDLYQKIYDNMQERLKDKVPAIRSQAVTALQRLQDPKSEDCPITKAFIFHLCSDPSVMVRKTVIQCIAATKYTLPHVLKRTRDVDESVRIAAYKFLSSKIHVRSLTIAQREQVLKRGMFERSEIAKRVVKKDVIPAWLRHSKDNIVELLYALDVGNSNDETISESMLMALFEDIPNEELFKNFQFAGEDKMIPVSKLTAETAVYWRNLAKKFDDDDDEKYRDLLLPELSKFCKYVRYYVIEMTRESEQDDEITWVFITKQLILMMNYFDLSDEAGRNNLSHLMKDMLLSNKLPVTLVPEIMKIFSLVCANPVTRINEIAEVIAEIREPMKDTVDDIFDRSSDEMETEGEKNGVLSDEDKRRKQVEMAKVRIQVNELKDDLDDAIQNRDFVLAQELKERMDSLDVEQRRLQDELTEAAEMAVRPKEPVSSQSKSVEEGEEDPKNDPVLVHKCLEMLYYLMKDPKIQSLNATLQTLLDEFVITNIRDVEFSIRQSAVRALGICLLRSKEDSKRHLFLLLQVSHLDVVAVRVTAISVIVDLLMNHGIATFTESEKDDDNDELESALNSESLSSTTSTTNRTWTQNEVKGGNSVVAVLIKMLDDTDLDIRTKIAEGLCKLQIIGAITSSKLFMRLILVWFNPLTDNDGKLCHILGTFFPLYASLSRSNQDCIEEAFVPVLDCLSNAPSTSPLAGVNVEEVALFFVQLTSEDILQNKSESVESNVHDSLAYSMSNMIIDSPHNLRSRCLTKALTNLKISTTNFEKLRELKVLHTKMMNVVKDKGGIRNLERYGSNLDAWLSKDTTFHDTPLEDEVASAATTTTTTFNSTSSRKRTLLSQEDTLYDSSQEENN